MQQTILIGENCCSPHRSSSGCSSIRARRPHHRRYRPVVAGLSLCFFYLAASLHSMLRHARHLSQSWCLKLTYRTQWLSTPVRSNAARMIGPAIAGVLIASVGSGWVFIINGVSFRCRALFARFASQRRASLERSKQTNSRRIPRRVFDTLANDRI